MKEKLEQAREYLKNVELECKDYCQNTEIPLNERWDFFVDNKLGDHSNYIIEFEYLFEDYTEYTQKNEVVNLEDMADNDLLKEEILQKFIKSFSYYW